jgi:kinesin family protein 13
VEKNRSFLVNLNSDPSLSEMLVYYLKERTMIGRTGDIQFFGVGIQVTNFSKSFIQIG